MSSVKSAVLFLAVVLWSVAPAAAADPAAGEPPPRPESEGPEVTHHEVAQDAYSPPPDYQTKGSSRSTFERNGFVSVQVNVDSAGANVFGDAANEPSIAVDPTAPNRIAVGWRQFNTVNSNFRQAGYGYSVDGGRSWTAPGSLEPSVFRSDPVLMAASDGRIYYNSLSIDGDRIVCEIFISDDGGQSWSDARPAYGGDKAWMAVDRSGGIGDGNLYASWSADGGCCGRRVFTRSIDRGHRFLYPLELDLPPTWGSMTIGPEGELYLAGNDDFALDRMVVARSLDARNPDAAPSFDYFGFGLGGSQVIGATPNPGGLVGQVWIAADTSAGVNRGSLYVISSVDPPGIDPMDVHFVRSDDRGETWTEPTTVNLDTRNAWQWFATMSVAPSGRIDVAWVESIDGNEPNIGELVYTSSADGGLSWAESIVVSPAFDSHLGWPRQNKLGDYYHMVSDDLGADLAYAATFNGEQDVYHLRLGDRDCNRNGIADAADLSAEPGLDCDANGIPDSCEIAAGVAADSDGDGVIDACVRGPRRPWGRRRP